MDASSAIGDIAVRLQNLTAQEKLVLRLRFALDGSYNHTLQDIADGLKISKDQVREIEQGALTKLARAVA
jgi:RNA polymerase primary sigma factor